MKEAHTLGVLVHPYNAHAVLPKRHDSKPYFANISTAFVATSLISVAVGAFMLEP